MPNTEINYPGAVQLKTPKSCLTPFYTQKSVFLVFIVLRYELLWFYNKYTLHIFERTLNIQLFLNASMIFTIRRKFLFIVERKMFSLSNEKMYILGT